MENIKIKNLTFSYPNSSNAALTDVSFELTQGELCLLIGESGSGKSTLLKLLNKKNAPNGILSGSITGNDRCAYVSQNIEENIVTDTVRNELSFSLSSQNLSFDEIESNVCEIAAYFNLEDKLDEKCSNLSGGQKQILNLASVMISNPSIIILDEPTSQLDPISLENFINLILKLHRDFAVTIIVAEHNTNGLYAMCDSVMYLRDGSVIIKDSPNIVCDYLKDNNSNMLSCIPLEKRLFTSASNIAQCRKELANCEIKICEDNKLSKDYSLRIKNAWVAYNKNDDVLEELSLNIYKNKINAIIGPNSSGKSTLLKVMAKVMKPYIGKVSSEESISLLTQNVYDLFNKERCEEETEFNELVSFLELERFKDRHPYDLSGGEAQRLALAKVLNMDSQIILLDEPTKGLDPYLKNKLIDIFNNIVKSGKTIVLVSHDLDFVGECADVVSLLSDKHIVKTETRKKFFNNMNFFTTTMSRISKGISDNLISEKDFNEAIK